MSSRCGRLFGAVGVLLALSGPAWGEAPNFDDDGPLPPRAVARLGTYRLWHGVAIAALAFSPDGKVVASGGGLDYPVCLWDLATGKLVRQINARNEGTVSRLAFSPDGKALATACRFAVRVWDVASGREMQHFEADSKVDEFLHFSADGKLLAAGEEGGTVEVWELATGKRLRRWRPWRAGPPRMKDGEPAEGCLRCALFPDGRTLLWQIVRWKLPALSESGRVFDRGKLRACDTATGKQRWQVECVREEMGALAVSPDGKLLAVGSGPVQILDAATGRKLVETEDPGALSAAHRLAFSPDGKTLVGAYSNTMCL